MSYPITYDHRSSDMFKTIGLQAAKLIACLTSCLLVGYIGLVYAGITFNTWFKYLAKPWFTPPDWVFAPAWAILFVLMGISVFMVWEHTTTYQKSVTLLIFYIQLAANICWSIAFFGICSTSGGLIIAICLLCLILWTIKRFYAISKIAAYLLVPYLLCVCFAAILNLSIYYLN